jgi:hypothetical protein
MTIAIKARTEAMTPKMMVPVESELDSFRVEAVVESMAGNDWKVEVVLSAGIVAVKDWVQIQQEDVIASPKWLTVCSS